MYLNEQLSDDTLKRFLFDVLDCGYHEEEVIDTLKGLMSAPAYSRIELAAKSIKEKKLPSRNKLKPTINNSF